MAVDYSNSINHDWVQVLSYNKYSLLFSPIVGIEPANFIHLELYKLNTYICYTMVHAE